MREEEDSRCVYACRESVDVFIAREIEDFRRVASR